MSEARGGAGAVRRYYGFQFCFGMLLWVPVFYDYQKKMGLTDAEIFGIQSVYYVAFCVLELPTGLLGDRWGYRACMRAGAAVLVTANLTAVLAPSYGGFLAHFLLVALSRSLVSGASSAYLYELLREQGRAGEYKRIEGLSRSYGLVGKVACWAGIGAAMQWKLSLPYWLTAAFSAAALGFALAMPRLESRRREASAQAAIEGAGASSDSAGGVAGWAALRARLAPVLAALGRSPMLALVMLQGVAMFVLARICTVNLFQPVLSAKGFALSGYGAVMSALTVFEALGSAYPGALRRLWGDLDSVFVLTAVMGLTIAGLAFTGQAGTVAAFCVFSWACGASFPIQRQLLNDAIPDSRYRATLLSMESLLDRAVCAWVAAFMGAYVSEGRVSEFLVVSGGASVAAMALLWAAMRWRRRAAPAF